MADKKKYLLRIDSEIYTALEKWAADELRSLNSQIEFLLTDALKRNSRFRTEKQKPDNPTGFQVKSVE